MTSPWDWFEIGSSEAHIRASPAARCVWVDPALDFRDALLVPQNQLDHDNHASHYNRHDRYQEGTQAGNRID